MNVGADLYDALLPASLWGSPSLCCIYANMATTRARPLQFGHPMACGVWCIMWLRHSPWKSVGIAVLPLVHHVGSLVVHYHPGDVPPTVCNLHRLKNAWKNILNKLGQMERVVQLRRVLCIRLARVADVYVYGTTSDDGSPVYLQGGFCLSNSMICPTASVSSQ